MGKGTDLNIKHFLLFAMILLIGCHNANNKSLLEEKQLQVLPPSLRDSFALKFINKCVFDGPIDSLDINNYLLELEKYRCLIFANCLDSAKQCGSKNYNFTNPVYEDSILESKFFFNKHSSNKDYALISSFYLFNFDECVSEDIGWKSAIMCAIFPEKLEILDSYSSYLDSQLYDSLWNGIFNSLLGTIIIADDSLSEEEQFSIIEKYYPYVYSKYMLRQGGQSRVKPAGQSI